MKVEKRYEGDLPPGKLEFVTPFDHVDGYMWLVEGERYLIFLQTAGDRKESNNLADAGLGTALSRLRTFTVGENNLGTIEEAITLISTYLELPETGQKPFVLENLTTSNSYIRPLIDHEVIRIRITEAIPYYRKKLRQAADEEGRLRQISTLRLLGDPDVKATLLEWLNDDSYKTKRDILEEFVRLGDKSVIPEIRKWIDVEDDQVAVTARSALLRLGEASAKGLLLEVIQRSDDPIARYNAILYLNSNNEHGFTEEEIGVIRPLVDDEQESVARGGIYNGDMEPQVQQAGCRCRQIAASDLRRSAKKSMQSRKETAWKKSRKFGDVKGGRKRPKLADNIFARAHSLQRPSAGEALPIFITDNPSRDYFFPIGEEEVRRELAHLPHGDWEGITHIWFRRFKKSEYEANEFPLAEFSCGSGVRLVTIYPWPRSLDWHHGYKKPSAALRRVLERYDADLSAQDGRWISTWQQPNLKNFYIEYLRRFARSVITLTGMCATGARRTIEFSKRLLINTLLAKPPNAQ